jgi:hypothetical protein
MISRVWWFSNLKMSRIRWEKLLFDSARKLLRVFFMWYVVMQYPALLKLVEVIIPDGIDSILCEEHSCQLLWMEIWDRKPHPLTKPIISGQTTPIIVEFCTCNWMYNHQLARVVLLPRADCVAFLHFCNSSCGSNSSCGRTFGQCQSCNRVPEVSFVGY